ncbi:hypothetical protein HMPREF3289_02920 [Pseudomonas sp. HMSC75E02]|nr:hypothetical protein HMPREF3289_02920 [Pseudomonas sp. HMSC75E02]
MQLALDCPGLTIQTLSNRIDVRRKAASYVRVTGKLAPGNLRHFLDGLVLMLHRLEQQLHVVLVELDGFSWGYRFIM